MTKQQKFGWALIIFSLTLMLAGCSTAWVGEATSIIETLVPAVSGIIGVIMAFGVNIPATVQSAIEKGANEVVNDLNNVVLPLINQYEAAPQSDRATILKQIGTAIQVVLNNWSSVLNAVHIEDSQTQAKVVAVMELILNELGSLASVIPVLQGLKSYHDTSVRMPMDAAHFEARYKELMAELPKPKKSKKG